jgi:hypothetical protein
MASAKTLLKMGTDMRNNVSSNVPTYLGLVRRISKKDVLDFIVPGK